ncbi:hypothetical protein JHK84_050064 [Glycine max]|nr:hypothetical protein JHK85_050790 [Glycine max]KAG5094476.1 hypothetical protein JHK84_050064 [Glycine max]
MASKNKNVPTVVYYDACVADCDNGIEFKGENNVLISMRRGMTFNALKTKIQHKMGLNQGQTITIVIYRYPIYVGSGMFNYQAVTISDNEDIDDINGMSHDYHDQNGFSDKVVGDFSDHEGEILANNNNNNNDNEDNDIQFLFQPTTIENVYRPYPNSVDVGDNQVPDNLAYRHFFDQQQQSDSHDGKLYVVSHHLIA